MKTKLIIFEGVHGVGKTTYLNELNNKEGYLNLYSDTSAFENVKFHNPNIATSEMYSMQFVSSAASKIHYLKLLSSGYDVIFIDRWFLSSAYFEIQRLDKFNSVGGVVDYMRQIEKELSKTFDVLNIVFKTSDENMKELPYKNNKQETSYVTKLACLLENYKIIELDKINGVFDIKEKTKGLW